MLAASALSSRNNRVRCYSVDTRHHAIVLFRDCGPHEAISLEAPCIPHKDSSDDVALRQSVRRHHHLGACHAAHFAAGHCICLCSFPSSVCLRLSSPPFLLTFPFFLMFCQSLLHTLDGEILF